MSRGPGMRRAWAAERGLADREGRAAGRGGFALVAALWLLVALGAVGLDASLRSVERRRAAANVVDQTRARAAAMAGTEYARSRLTDAMLGRAEQVRKEILDQTTSERAERAVREMGPGRLARAGDPFEDPWRAPHERVRADLPFGDARVALRLRDAGAALNLNEADEDMLRAFFARGLRLDFGDADRLARAILDWRDQDDIPRLNGGEREQYLDARMPMLPPNRPFAELDELRHVMGMTPALFARATPLLTLVGSGSVNVNAAPEPVLLALPGMTEAAAAELIRLRESGRTPRNEDELRGLLPAGAWRPIDRREDAFERAITWTTREVEVVAEGRVEGGPVRVVAHLVVRRADTEAAVVWRRIG